MPKYKKGQNWNRALTSEMKEFKRKTGKNPVYRGKITGNFEYWLWKRKPVKPIKPKSVKPKKVIKIIKRKVTDDKIYQNYLQKIEKCEKNPLCSKFQTNKIQGNIEADYKQGNISQEKAKELMTYAQKVYDNKVREDLGIKHTKVIKSKIKVIVHLPYGKANNLFLTINFMSPRVRRESKKDIQKIVEDTWADKYMYHPKGYVKFTQLLFDKEGDIYLRYKIELITYDTKKDLEKIFNDLAIMIYKESKFIPTGIRVTAYYSGYWKQKYQITKEKIDSLSPYERIIIKELDHKTPSTKLAVVRSLKKKYPKVNISMINVGRYSTNLFKKNYIKETGITTGGLGRMKLTKEGKLIKDLLQWS